MSREEGGGEGGKRRAFLQVMRGSVLDTTPKPGLHRIRCVDSENDNDPPTFSSLSLDTKKEAYPTREYFPIFPPRIRHPPSRSAFT